MAGDREECMAAGMDDYLSKPIRVKELAGALSRCLSPHSADESRAAALRPTQQDRDTPGTDPGDAEALDPAAIHRLLAALGDGGADLVGDLIATFQREAPELLVALRDAAEAADADDVRRVSHTLKSNGVQFGARRFAELCRQLEGKSAAGRLDSSEDLVVAIETEFARVRRALETVVEGLNLPHREVPA